METPLNISLVTTFPCHMWETVARDCIVSAFQYWPIETTIFPYWEGSCPMSGLMGKNLLEIAAVQEFMRRHAKNKVVQGLVEGQLKWGPKAKGYGYNFRADAYKFSRKVYAVSHMAERSTGKLFWIDADVITHKAIPRTFFDLILPDDCCFSYLDRPGYHPELGFLGINLDREETRALIRSWQNVYDEDKFLEYSDGWTDCHTFAHLVKLTKISTYKIRHSSQAQPFDHSVLAQYMTHLKGKRKDASA